MIKNNILLAFIVLMCINTTSLFCSQEDEADVCHREFNMFLKNFSNIIPSTAVPAMVEHSIIVNNEKFNRCIARAHAQKNNLPAPRFLNETDEYQRCVKTIKEQALQASYLQRSSTDAHKLLVKELLYSFKQCHQNIPVPETTF